MAAVAASAAMMGRSKTGRTESAGRRSGPAATCLSAEVAISFRDPPIEVASILHDFIWPEEEVDLVPRRVWRVRAVDEVLADLEGVPPADATRRSRDRIRRSHDVPCRLDGVRSGEHANDNR